MVTFGWVVAAVIGLGAIVWGAGAFAEHLGKAAVALRVSSFALALLLAGAEPEELATGIIASARHVPALAFGDVIGANVAMCLVALGVGAIVAPLPFGPRVRRYGLLSLPLGVVCAAFVWGGHVSRRQGGILVALYVAYVAVIWALEGARPRSEKQARSKKPENKQPRDASPPEGSPRTSSSSSPGWWPWPAAVCCSWRGSATSCTSKTPKRWSA